MYIYNAKSVKGASACRENEINKINGLPLILTDWSFSWWDSFNSVTAKGKFDQTKKTSKSVSGLLNNSGMTTQVKALNEHFQMVMFTLLLNRVHSFWGVIWIEKRDSESKFIE